jgi:phosphohistidine phosphatase
MTARIIAAAINYPLENILYSETIYEFSENVLIHVVKQIDDAVNKAMVVGHNPATNGLANYIGDQPISNIPTCGVFCVELEISSWEIDYYGSAFNLNLYHLNNGVTRGASACATCALCGRHP